jgi:ABC-type polysaccharide/polyol phosphate transport system ATPase subunit
MTVIRVQGVSKKFCRSVKRGMLYSAIDVFRDTLGIRANSDQLRRDEFWSLQDVSFEIRRGECVGLIGCNGAGKSTMLKLLNGIIRPDNGSIQVTGRAGALIEVGAGFHPLLSGRENIYINGAILGMSAGAITEKIDAIVEFSGLDPAVLDAPVKTYSSGMYVRLGFAVAVHAEPDVLLVDEVLAVGDLDFQSKCWRRIHELKRRGTTILLVCHSGLTVREICETAIWLENGHIRQMGPSDEVVNAYEQDVVSSMQNDALASSQTAAHGYALNLRFFDSIGRERHQFQAGERVRVQFDVVTPAAAHGLHLLIEFHSVQKPIYASYCTEWDGTKFVAERGHSSYTIDFEEFNLPVGDYMVSSVLAENSIVNHRVWNYCTKRISVTSPPRLRGDVFCPHEWAAHHPALVSEVGA